MSTWMHNHPVLFSIAAWAILVLLIASPFLIRAWRRSTGDQPEQSGFTDDPLDKPVLELRLEDRIPVAGIPGEPSTWSAPAPPKKRVPMLSRFVPDSAHGLSHDLAMVDQILGDQAMADVPAGGPTDAPAPGEEGYTAPSERIRVIVGPYTIILDRGHPTSVSEERPNGAHWPMAEVPGEWEPVVIALAMEVLRLREGWRVSEADWQPR